MSDDPLWLVTIMNYPPLAKFRRMCHAFLDSAIANGARRITILYENHRPVVAPEHRRAADIEVVQKPSHDVGHPHFNLRFKLANLAGLPEPFLYLDSDMFVLRDLNELWRRRHDKPWIGVNHQVIPCDLRTHRAPFLNSGLQLVSDPSFYDLQAILDVQNSAVPLSRHATVKKLDMFPCPGQDQAILFRYFTTIGYDYTHSNIGPEWNSCAGVTVVERDSGRWTARTQSLARDHEVYIIHYWDMFKPWAMNCPIFRSYEWVDEASRHWS